MKKNIITQQFTLVDYAPESLLKIVDEKLMIKEIKRQHKAKQRLTNDVFWVYYDYTKLDYIKYYQYIAEYCVDHYSRQYGERLIMKDFLFARHLADANDAIICIPYDRIRSMHLTGATALKIQFVGDDGAAGSVICGITSGKSLEVMKAIVNAQRASGNSFVNIGNEIDKTYIHENLTEISTIEFDN